MSHLLNVVDTIVDDLAPLNLAFLFESFLSLLVL